ncbi:Origin recognition complex subunit 2, partial [Nowakowskiella sp. JEL0078]
MDLRVNTANELNDREQLLLAQDSLVAPNSPKRRQPKQNQTPISNRNLNAATPTKSSEKENVSIIGANLIGFEQNRTPGKNDVNSIWTPSKGSRALAAAKLFTSPSKFSERKRTFKTRIEGATSEDEDIRDAESNSNDELEFASDNDDMSDDMNDDPNSIESVFNSSHERFFKASKSKSQTSNNTLSKLPTLSPADFQRIRSQLGVKHKEFIKDLNCWHKELFPQWLFELTLGRFSLMFYGYGSKTALIDEFVATHLTDAPAVVVNGFFPSITLREILLQIVNGVMKLDQTPSSPIDLLALIKGYFLPDNKARKWEKIYLIIHNIDGANLRTDKTQMYLSYLSNIPEIHLIASIEHIHAPLLWDTATTSRFNFLWHDVTTFTPYVEEVSFETSLMVGMSSGNNEITVRAAIQVLKSVNGNARKLFGFVAKQQANANEGENGISYEMLYAKCKEEFVASNDVTFRALLTEFKDHKMIVTRDVDGGETLIIPMNKD